MEESLKAMGFDTERLWLRWISASEGGKFAETITDFTNKLKALGPNPTKELWMV